MATDSVSQPDDLAAWAVAHASANTVMPVFADIAATVDDVDAAIDAYDEAVRHQRAYAARWAAAITRSLTMQSAFLEHTDAADMEATMVAVAEHARRKAAVHTG